jgi:hypothetical protein
MIKTTGIRPINTVIRIFISSLLSVLVCREFAACPDVRMFNAPQALVLQTVLWPTG